MPPARKPAPQPAAIDNVTASRVELEQLRWLADQVRRREIAPAGVALFDIDLMLPPARSLGDAIDLARAPFTAGNAKTPRLSRSARRATYGYECVECEPVELEHLPGVKMGLHGEPDHRFRWTITDFLTGYAVAQGSSPADVLAKAKRLTSRLDSERRRENIARARADLFESTKHHLRMLAIKKNTAAKRRQKTQRA